MKISCLAALALCALAARAEEPARVEQLDTVSVNMVRDASLIPYGRINELMAGLQRHGEGLIRMEFRLKARDPSQPLQSPKLAVQHADRYIAIPIAPDGLFELPLLPQEQAQEADLASNQPKGRLSVVGTLKLTVKPQDLDMATVRRLMAVSHKLRSEMLPWYVRLLFPQVDGVRICSEQPAWSLQWPEQGQRVGVPLTADARDRDPDAAKGEAGKPCTTLTGQEAWPDAARLVAPGDTQLSIRLRG